MNKELTGKVVIVTGAGGGIGREIALAMAAYGAKVVVNDLGTSSSGEGANMGPGESVVQEIRNAGGEAVLDGHSVAGWDDAHAIVQTAIDTYGRLDCVVNNAGILRDRIFYKMSKDDWEQVVAVHLMGSFYVSRAAADIFKEQNSGSYVHMTSTSGLIGNLGQANYSAAKLGVAALSKSIALDMAKFNVRSNCIAPFAWTRLIGTLPENTEAERVRAQRFRAMDAAKIAPLAVYLASDQGSEVSGQIFSVRSNEIMLFGQPRPICSVHRSEGWTLESIAGHAIPALKRGFYPLERSPDVINWDPV